MTDQSSEKPDPAAAAPIRLIHVWADPPDTEFPLTTSPVRLAVGTPRGTSSNSWKVWVRGEDTYVACRDNFREFKVSLHASGIWRLGLTEEFAKARPDMLLPQGNDRVWKKWRPTLDVENRLAIGFQLVVPATSLYLSPKDRVKWSRKVVFVEPPASHSELTVVSVSVVLGHEPVVFASDTFGAVVAIVPLGVDRTVQLVVTHENSGDLLPLIGDAFQRAQTQLKDDLELPDSGVFFVHGDRGANTPWVAALPFHKVATSDDA